MMLSGKGGLRPYSWMIGSKNGNGRMGIDLLGCFGWHQRKRSSGNCFFCPFFLFFQGTFPLPHSCGAVAPQLWGSCTTAVRQLHHSCGATEISEIKTNLMLAQSTKRASGTDRPLEGWSIHFSNGRKSHQIHLIYNMVYPYI